MGARDDIASPLELFLLQLADDRNCLTDDLSVAMMRAAETFGLECYRRGAETAAENAPTLPHRRPLPAESQTLPVVRELPTRGLWDPDASTPATPPAQVRVPRDAWPYRSKP